MTYDYPLTRPSMTMVSGTVSVDSTTGLETYTPNNATNYAKALYALLLTASSTATVQTIHQPLTPILDSSGKTIGCQMDTVTHVITPTIQMKQAQAQIANTFAGVIDFIKAQASITTTIPATSAGDGLQTSATAGSATTHPSSAKPLQGAIS